MLAAASLTLAAPTPVAEAERARLKDLQVRIGTLRGDLAKSEETRAEAADQLRATESAISDTNRGLRELGELREQTRTQVAGLGEQNRRLADQIAAQQAQLGRLLYRQYLNGEADALQLLLAGNDPNQAARDLRYLSLLSRAEANLLRVLRLALAEKQRLIEAAQVKQNELVGIEQRRQAQRAALLGQQQQRRQVLTRLSSKIELQRREIDSLKRNEKRLGNLIAGLSRIVAKKPAVKAPGQVAAGKQPNEQSYTGDFARQKGRLNLPARGELTNRYGSPRAEGGGMWKGLFIRAAEGTEVHTVAAGRVVFADWLRGFGNLIIVDHGDAYLSVYGNNQSLFRQVGDTVKSGETLAAVGNSGGNPETGLYFELRHQGTAIDPLKWAGFK